MSAHTPGPWCAAKNSKTGKVWLIGTRENVVATTPHNSSDNEANATLIASAPELLAALHEIAECGIAVLDPGYAIHGGNLSTEELIDNGCESGDRTYRNLSRMVRMARAAIAKAEGGSCSTPAAARRALSGEVKP